MEGDDHGEAYTAIVWGVGLSHVIPNVAGAEAVGKAEGNMCGTDMRGAVALPGSKATSRTKGSRRNLGGLMSPAIAEAVAGRDGKPRRRSRRGRHEESDGFIVPMKHPNKTAMSGGGGCGGKGPGREERVTLKHITDTAPNQCVTGGATPRIDAAWPPRPRTSVTPDFRQEPGAGKPHAGI